MGEFERTVFVGNYKIPRHALTTALQQRFGPCFAKEPLQPKTEGQNPYGFAIFEREADAQACLAIRKMNINGEDIFFSSANRVSGRGANSSTTSGYQFGAGMSNGAHNRPLSSSPGSNTQFHGQQPQRFKAILSHSNGLDELYVQDVSGTRAVQYLRLQEDLSKHCQAASSVTSPQKGQMYAALFSEDKNWYRCEVVNKNPDYSYAVQFVDYGNQSTVKCEEIKMLSTDLKAVPPAATKCHIRDLIAKVSCLDQVKQLLLEWNEILLDGEMGSDKSIDLVDTSTGKSLRTALVNSTFVTLNELLDDNSSSSSETSKANKRKGGKKHGAANNQQSGDSHAQPQVDKAVRQQIETLNTDNATLRKQLSVATKKISQLANRKSIDVLNKELSTKLSTIRTLRPKFRMAADGVLNQAIALLGDKGYTKEVHDETFNPVFSTYTEYNKQQDLLRQLKPSVDTLDNSMIESRNKARAEFCDAVKLCQQKCQEMKVDERRSQLNDILVKLSDFYPEVNTEPFEGDVEQTIANFTQWQKNEGEKITQVQNTTADALTVLGKQLEMLQQSLDLDMNISVETDIKLEAATQLATSALDGELEAIDMSEGNSRFEVIRQLCCALQSKIGQEFDLLDNMHSELSKLQKQAVALEPYFGVTQPENLEWLQKKEKKLKELRSKLRHRMADLDDLKENDEESDTDVSGMEEQVDEVRKEIQSVLAELEKGMNDLAHVTYTVFPEFALQYPKLCVVKPSESYIKPLRDISFYKDNGTTLTTFGGKPVIVKTVHAPVGATNYIPDIVKQILNTPSLNSYVSLDAIFFSKNGQNTYIQMSSDYDEITSHLRDAPAIVIESLTEAVCSLSIGSSASADNVTAEEASDDSVDTSGSETNIGA